MRARPDVLGVPWYETSSAFMPYVVDGLVGVFLAGVLAIVLLMLLLLPGRVGA